MNQLNAGSTFKTKDGTVSETTGIIRKEKSQNAKGRERAKQTERLLNSEFMHMNEYGYREIPR